MGGLRKHTRLVPEARLRFLLRCYSVIRMSIKSLPLSGSEQDMLILAIAVVLVNLAVLVATGVTLALPGGDVDQAVDVTASLQWQGWLVGHQVVLPAAIVLVVFVLLTHAFLVRHVEAGLRLNARLALGCGLFLLLGTTLDLAMWYLAGLTTHLGPAVPPTPVGGLCTYLNRC